MWVTPLKGERSSGEKRRGVVVGVAVGVLGGMVVGFGGSAVARVSVGLVVGRAGVSWMAWAMGSWVGVGGVVGGVAQAARPQTIRSSMATRIVSEPE